MARPMIQSRSPSERLAPVLEGVAMGGVLDPESSNDGEALRLLARRETHGNGACHRDPSDVIIAAAVLPLPSPSRQQRRPRGFPSWDASL